MLEQNNRNILVNGDSLRVLIIDDDKDYQALCARYLSQDTQYSFILNFAETAKQALSICRNQEFDCILVDYKLPDSVGTDVVFDLHCALGQWMPPAVIVSANGGEEAATQALRVNAADFLPKRDVTASSLIGSIEKVIKKTRLESATRLQNNRLSEAYNKLQNESEEIKSFYSTVAHDLNTPLVAMKEFLSLIRDEVVGPINKDQKELINYSLESCDQITNHFNNLLDLTRLQAGTLQLNRQLDSPSRVIKNRTRAIASVAEKKGIKLEDKSSEILPEISIDSERIAQVLSNLLDNAIKYTNRGGSILINSTYNKREELVEIQVEDSGCGIEARHSDQAYDSLSQINAHDVNEQSAELGVGLTISRELVKLHGGQLEVQSQVGLGSIFTVKLEAQSHA
ncbi:MAG: ATP-binding protein [Granulosicoccus sp.]